MGKGQIINNFGDGRYAVKLLQNRVQADKALARIDTWIALNQTRQDALPPGDPEHKFPMLKLSMASLLKQKEYLLLIPQDEIAVAWCADLTEDLSGEVGTIEINGDPTASVNIRPGYNDNAAHVPARDGQTMNIRAMTPEQAFYNLAMMPGWQKWKPTYRIGAITSINGNTCSVRLDDVNSSIKGAEYNINQALDLTDVDIEYMYCNGAAFESGDRVIVQFTGQDFEVPKLIGFEDNPKPCIGLMFISVNENHIIEYYKYDGGSTTLVKTFDINSICSAPNGGYLDMYPIADFPHWQYVNLIQSSGDLNRVIVSCWVSDWRGNTVNITPEGAEMYGSFNRYRTATIPLSYYGDDKITKDSFLGLIPTHVPELAAMNPAGLQVGTTNRSIMGASGIRDYFGNISLTEYNMTTFIYPVSENIEWPIQIWAVGVYGNYVLLCMIYETLIGGAYSISTKMHISDLMMNITKTRDMPGGSGYADNPMIGVNQIVGHNSKFYVFYGQNYLYSTGNIQIEVLDINLNVILSKRAISGVNGTKQSIVSIVDILVNMENITCLSFITDDDRITGNVSFVDVDTLELVTQINTGIVPALTQSYDIGNNYNNIHQIIPNFITTQLPIVNYFTKKLNEYRFTQPPHLEYMQYYEDYNMPCGYVGYSKRLSECAQKHAEWCASQGRSQHEDANDLLSYSRGNAYGFRYACTLENIAAVSIVDFPTHNSQIDEAFRMWQDSPGHDANLTRYDLTTFGYGYALIAENVKTITFGIGSYINGTYTTAPITRPLGPSEIGKIMFFVYNPALP